jgi:hypothetical protein
MDENETTQSAPQTEMESLEERRAAARRRFLRRGAASGAILTFFHQRTYAWQTKTILVSSKDTCISLHGTPPNGVKPKSVMDSLHRGQTVTRYECTINK